MIMEARKAWNLEYKRKREVWRQRFTEFFPDRTFTGKAVLELGVGNGKTLQKILLQNPARVSAVDFSPVAIRLCKEKFKNTEFFEASACGLPFKGGEFDIVVCFHTLGHLLKPERKKAVKEIKRVLKKGGNVLFEDFAVGDFRFGKGKKIEDNTFKRGNGITYHYFTASEVKRLFGMKGKVELVEKSLKLAGKKVKRKEIKAELFKV